MLLKCIYSESEQQELIKLLVEECIQEEFKTESSKVDNSGITLSFYTGGSFGIKLSILASVLKNNSFKEEEEWRLLSEGAISAQLLQFRHSRSTIIPYFNFSLGSKPEYIKSLTVGPSPDTQLTMEALNVFRMKNICFKAKFYETEIPFRNW